MKMRFVPKTDSPKMKEKLYNSFQKIEKIDEKYNYHSFLKLCVDEVN